MTPEAFSSPLDPDAAQRLAADPGASVWVAASAGTGKTKVLIDRVLGLMLSGVRPQRILCLTFTKAAAAEMSNRIAETLGRWAIAPAETLDGELTRLVGRAPDDRERRRARTLFARVLDTPGGMHIETIHAFCQSLLRRFPLEADIAPHFAVMDERDAQEMLAAAREEVLIAAQADETSLLAQALARVTTHAHEETFNELLGALAADRGRLARTMERFDHSVEAADRALRRVLGLAPEDTPESLLAAGCDDVAFDAFGLRLAVTALEQGSAKDKERAQTIAHWLAAPVADRPAEFATYSSVFLTTEGRRKERQSFITKKAIASTPGVGEIMETEADRLETLEDRCRAAAEARATTALLRLGEALLAAYRRQKDSRALLDYDDLILTAVRLLETEGSASWVLYKLDEGIEHVLIDEAQDTNPDQWRVVDVLTREFFSGRGTRDSSRTVFAVGDVKQSIYSFQRADPAAFFRMRDHFETLVPAAGETWRQVDLTVSFRSTPAVLAAVDAVFRPGVVAANGVALDGRLIEHRAMRAGAAGLVELWPPVEPRDSDAPAPWKPPVERFPGDSPQGRLARLVARRIRIMTDGAEMLESRGRPVRPGDIMVLVRRRTPFVEDLVRALKDLNVEVAGVDRMVITDQMAVMDLVALGRFLLLPDDDLTLATVLKGPLLGLDEDSLFHLAYGREETSLWDTLRARRAETSAFSAAHAELSRLLALVDHTPPFELFSHILGAGRGREKLLARLGHDALDPLAEFLDLALAHERQHVPSLEGFLHWVEAGAVEVKRDLEQESQDAVRVMTVHGAKGLQAPVVFLPDTLQAPLTVSNLLWPADGQGGEVLLWPPSAKLRDPVAEKERDRLKELRDQEYRRLLYVAMTRAEDRLYVCGWRTRKAPPENCWHDLIRDGLRDVAREEEEPFLAAARETGSAMVLRLTSLQEATAPKSKGAAVAEPMEALPEWARTLPEAEPDPPRPLVPSRPDADEPPVRSPLGADDGLRFRRGRLVHRLLQSLPDLPAPARPAAARSFLSRQAHGLDPDQVEAIAAETLAVLDHPDFASLFGPGSQAEVPIIGRVAGRVLSAQVDRLLVTPEEILVVDYKTNRPPPRELEQVPGLYLGQMAAYRAALRAMYPERRVRCLLLWTDGPDLMALPDPLLDRVV